jgi:hypothetical protein
MGSSGRRGTNGGHGRESGARKGCSHIDDRGSHPYGSSMATPLSYSAPITEQTPRQGTPMVSGAGQLCEAPREGCGLPEARLLQPRQSDLCRIHIPAVKDALRSVHRQVYHRPVSLRDTPEPISVMSRTYLTFRERLWPREATLPRQRTAAEADLKACPRK